MWDENGFSSEFSRMSAFLRVQLLSHGIWEQGDVGLVQFNSGHSRNQEIPSAVFSYIPVSRSTKQFSLEPGI